MQFTSKRESDKRAYRLIADEALSTADALDAQAEFLDDDDPEHDPDLESYRTRIDGLTAKEYQKGLRSLAWTIRTLAKRAKAAAEKT